ncbi:MAG: NAD(P)H-hydrate epimerase [Candidatus Nanopelagicales bacterium]|nr:NAD(P)H-hydrate epimerase [Candidatus Nanopelagicales bacterium]
MQTVRRAEAGVGVPEPVLMQRAATGLAGTCVELLAARRGRVVGGRVVALVGSGSNGGDALWALARLARRGVGAVAVGDPTRMHASGVGAARAAGARVMDWADPQLDAVLAAADLALDGIVGIGGSGGLRREPARAVEVLVAAGVPIVAVDVPSGVDSDTGEVAGAAVPAAVTVCFGVLKPGLLVPPGRDHAGTVHVVDIGLRPADLEPAAQVLDLADLALPAPSPTTHKYRRGVVEVLAGSAGYPGAALLAVGGARRAGAGMVAFRGGSGASGLVDPVAALVAGRFPDVVLAQRPARARCVGPGLDEVAGGAELVLEALADPAPVVVDASGLAVLAGEQGRAALADRVARGWVTVLTPHAGEFARLGFDPAGGPLVAARRAAGETGVVMVLKGPGTVVAAPDGAAFVDPFGTASLATAGAGDVLAGLMAGMLAGAGGAGEVTAAMATLVAARAVGWHGLAGRLAAAEGTPVTATDVLAHLPAAQAVADAARVG